MSAPALDPLARRGPSLRSRILRHWQLYVLLIPALIYLIVFKYWPMYGVQIVKPWVLWRVFYLEPVVAGWGSSIVWLVLWLSAWSVSSGGGV